MRVVWPLCSIFEGGGPIPQPVRVVQVSSNSIFLDAKTTLTAFIGGSAVPLICFGCFYFLIVLETI